MPLSHFYYNLWVATDDLSGYLEALWISLGATDAGVMGAAMDARTEPWFGKIIGGLQGKREYLHGFSMVCRTFAGYF